MGASGQKEINKILTNDSAVANVRMLLDEHPCSTYDMNFLSYS